MHLVFVPRRVDKLEHTCALLASSGYETLRFPLISFKSMPYKIPRAVEGIVVTSSGALESMPKTRVPLYCVGQSTALEAIKHGFNVRYTGKGNAKALAEWLLQNEEPQYLLHPTTDDAEQGWYSLLEDAGFTITPILAYKKTYTPELPADVVCCLTENKVSFTLVFSAKSAEALTKLYQQHDVPLQALGTVVTISDKVAKCFPASVNTRVAKAPNLQEMIHVLEQASK